MPTVPPPLYLFEFCDQTWLPAGARECLFQLMDLCNSGMRSFNKRVADETLQLARAGGYDTIVELGAGRAPITSLLAQDERAKGLTLVPCDLFPNHQAYRRLQERHPERVRPIYEPVDITQRNPMLDGKVLVMAGMMHHVPFPVRPAVLQALSETNSCSVIFEPLKRTLFSMALVLLAFFPALALPLLRWRRQGRLRRMLWCWLIPVVPVMFVWDGLVSCLRQSTSSEYLRVLQAPNCRAHDVHVDDRPHSLELCWRGGSDAGGR